MNVIEVAEWKQRVIEEHKALEDKRTKLDEFIAKGCPGADGEGKVLLCWQSVAMSEYASVLKLRISRF